MLDVVVTVMIAYGVLAAVHVWSSDEGRANRAHPSRPR